MWMYLYDRVKGRYSWNPPFKQRQMEHVDVYSGVHSVPWCILRGTPWSTFQRFGARLLWGPAVWELSPAFRGMKWSDPSKEALPSAWAGNPGNGKETSANQRSSVNLKTWTFFDFITSMDEKHFKHTSPHGCCWDLLIEPLQVIHINFRLFRQHVCNFHARDWYSCNSSSSRREPGLSAEFGFAVFFRIRGPA